MTSTLALACCGPSGTRVIIVEKSTEELLTTQISAAGSAKRILWIVALGLLTGCALPISPYAVSSSDITSIRSAHKAIDLGDFSDGPTSASCRGEGIAPEGGRSFAQYIRDAFNDEIVIAGLSTTRDRSTVSLKVLNIDVTCGLGTAFWIVEVEVRVGEQAPYIVKTIRNFEATIFVACYSPACVSSVYAYNPRHYQGRDCPSNFQG